MDVVDVSAPPRPPWRRRRYQAAAAVIVVAALGTGGVLLTWDRKPKPEQAVESSTEAGVTVTNYGSMPKDHHTLRVVSGRTDLSGRHELAWAADTGHPVREARCTQNFKIGPTASARVRPTMLMCWRTSASRSVFTVSVDLEQRPSEQESVDTIDKVWSTLG
jgi:hypothetical protein